MSDELEDAIAQESLADADEKTRLALNEAVAPSKPAEKPAEEVPEEIVIDFSHTSGRGKVYEGKITYSVLDVGETIRVGIMAAHLRAGADVSAMDTNTLNLTEMMATIIVGCRDPKPDWMVDLLGLKDTSVIEAIYQEVASHEARFRGKVG